MNDGKQSAEYLRMVLPLMSKYQVPVLPQNYAVWYEYVVGQDQNLKASINKVLESGNHFSTELNLELFNRYVKDKDENLLKNAQSSTQVLVSDLSVAVKQNMENVHHYEGILSHSAAELKNAESGDLTFLVQELVSETEHMTQLTAKFEKNLELTSAHILTLGAEFAATDKLLLTDILTGLANKEGFFELLANEIKCAEVDKDSLSLMLLSIDQFSRFADSYGNMLGDKLIRFIANLLVHSIKRRDITTRFERSVFAIILPATQLDGAARLGDIVREKLAKQKLRLSDSKQSIGSVTLSIGVAQFKIGESVDKMSVRCQKAMQLAEARGRNRVITELEL